MNYGFEVYKINNAVASFMAQNVDAETGEIANPDLLMNLQMEQADIYEQIALCIKNLKRQAEEIRAEEVALADRRNRKLKTAESLSDLLSKELNGQKFETPKCCVSFRASKKVIIDDEEKATSWFELSGHDDCISYKSSIDKKKAKALLESGIEIPYCRIEESINMGVK